MNLLDPTLIVLKALFAGLRVKVGEYEFCYEPEEEEVFIVGKTFSGDEVLLRTGETLSLNGFIKMVHRELTEGERMGLVAQLGLLRERKQRR